MFLLCSISVLVKRYEARVNLQERLVSLKTFLKSAQNQSLSREISLGSSHEIGRSLPIVFQRIWLVLKIPAKSAFFSANVPLKIP